MSVQLRKGTTPQTAIARLNSVLVEAENVGGGIN